MSLRLKINSDQNIKNILYLYYRFKKYIYLTLSSNTKVKYFFLQNLNINKKI